MTDMIGWLSSVILLITIIKQLRSQWKNRSNDGVSKWLWAGQLAASTGFIIYSWKLQNWVFVITNGFLWISNLVGILVYIRNKKTS